MLYKQLPKGYDESLIDDLFKNWDFHGENKISIEDFFNNYVQEEQFARQKVHQLTRIINEIVVQIKGFQEKLSAAKANERPNQYNIMEGSMLMITIIEARELRSLSGGIPDSYVEVIVGDNKVKTNLKNQTSSPNWNEKTSLYYYLVIL